METHIHTEKHFTAGDIVRDIVIGMSDGLTVPFALAAGLSGALSQTHVIVTAGLAEVTAGAIAMGLGGYLAARGDAEHYASEKAREEHEVKMVPELGVNPEEQTRMALALLRRVRLMQPLQGCRLFCGLAFALPTPSALNLPA
jgi:hypothetical protein